MHHAGAALLLFERPGAPPVLHCGDCRYHRARFQGEPALQRICGRAILHLVRGSLEPRAACQRLMPCRSGLAHGSRSAAAGLAHVLLPRLEWPIRCGIKAPTWPICYGIKHPRRQRSVGAVRTPSLTIGADHGKTCRFIRQCLVNGYYCCCCCCCNGACLIDTPSGLMPLGLMRAAGV